MSCPNRRGSAHNCSRLICYARRSVSVPQASPKIRGGCTAGPAVSGAGVANLSASTRTLKIDSDNSAASRAGRQAMARDAILSAVQGPK